MRGKAQTHGLDARIAALAGRQHGVVGRRQLLDLGAGPGSIDRRVSAGRLHRIHRGVYAAGHTVLSREGRWAAAVLACGPGAVLSHRSAAALWGMLGDDGGAIDVTAPRKCRSKGAIRRHRAVLVADEWQVEDAIAVTTAPRTIFDLAATAPAAVVESALRRSEFLRLYDRLSLRDLLARHPDHRGARAIRAALARFSESSGDSRSWLEQRFLPFLDGHHLPRPQLNVWLHLRGHEIQVDCLWPGPRRIVELDGWQGHGTHAAFRSDRARDRALEAAGYRVTRIAWEHLNNEPTTVAADLRLLLAQPPVNER